MTLVGRGMPSVGRRVWRKLLCGLLSGGAASALLAAPPVLDLPVRCRMGSDCFIQNFFDRDVGPGYQDYACGKLTFDGHAGTDFRVRDQPAMARGVEVIAAAGGKVLGTRDGEPDIPVRIRGLAALQGKEAGNGLLIDHGDGWTTQYSHLQRGSVRVAPGQSVERGAVLGLIGESGNADFPHLDFTVRHNGKPVDPFAPGGAVACGEARESLWSPATLQALAYQPTGLLIAGFAAQAPERDGAEAGAYAASDIPGDAPLLVFWAELFGVAPGDRWRIDIRDPAGRDFAGNAGVVERHQAIFFTAAGKRREGAVWPSGQYRASFRLWRADRVIVEETRAARVP